MNEEDYLIYLDFVRRYEKRIPLNQTESGKKLLIKIKQKIKDYENNGSKRFTKKSK